jgi:hypothetical protein
MKKRVIIPFLIVIIVVSFSLLAGSCSNNAEPSSPTLPPSSVVDEATLEQAQSQLEEKGWVALADRHTTSQVVDYKVALPSYVPAGFEPVLTAGTGLFLVQIPGFSLPASMRPESYPTVQITYALQQGEPSLLDPFFMITQTPDKMDTGGQTLEINGHQGTRNLLPGGSNRAERLVITWTDGRLYYTVMSTLVSPLDEDSLLRIAASIKQ